MNARVLPLVEPQATSTPTSAAASTLDDDVLMAAYKGGDAAAFRVLVERPHGPVYRFCLRSLSSPEAAADAVQEVFLRVVKHAPTWERKAKFTTWLYTIARNHCIDEARKRTFRRTESLNEPLRHREGEERGDQVAASTVRSDVAVDGKQLRRVFDAALEELPVEQREVFCMREYGGLGFKEIADAVGANENTIKSRMRYALTSLQRALGRAGFGPGDAT